jgi:hypothetical protein
VVRQLHKGQMGLEIHYEKSTPRRSTEYSASKGPVWHKRDNTRVRAITQILGAKVAKITRHGRQIDRPPRVYQIDSRFFALCHALTELFLFAPLEPNRA